ncbi:MAG: hypothetical protein H0S85_08830 [Desulfovibrionaceae bacterium]|jgi:hypothetical protein|nr:hypothetical protein [Desulfovibrionaceae bacterium]
MTIDWKKAFCRCKRFSGKGPHAHAEPLTLATLAELKGYLDCVHIRHCLLKPYAEQEKYPLVEARELLPSFDADVYEHTGLPGFSLVALERPLRAFQEIFQYDILHGLISQGAVPASEACPLEQTVIEQNLARVRDRLPRALHDEFAARFGAVDFTDLEQYPDLLPFLLTMDRGQVISLDSYGNFFLSGTYASFPSDLDTEIKRFGVRIGKFAVGDDGRYERNRDFVYQYLMELYGFPIVSERRTSAALFARRLHKLGEAFLIRVLGQSDRTLTTIFSDPNRAASYPLVEKIALVSVDEDQKDVLRFLKEGGYFVDARKRVVIVRVRYRQHRFNPNNVRQDRALSVAWQEVVHPFTGRAAADLNIIKDATNMFLRLNDIVRGEFTGRIVYKRHEVVENTETDEKRLKFLYSWLSKHQRRIIGYSDEFYANVVKVLDNYLLNPDKAEALMAQGELFQEVWEKYSYIRQARKAKYLEDLEERVVRGKRIGHLEALKQAAALLNDLRFEIVDYFDELVAQVIGTGEAMLENAYLVRTYMERKDDDLTAYGLEIKKHYGKLVSLLDELRAIRRSRQEAAPTGDPGARLSKSA